MGHQQRGETAEFNGEIPVGDRIQAVFSGPVKAQQFGGQIAVNRVSGAGQGSSTQRHHVHPLAAILQTIGITHQHFVPGQQMVAEGNRLGGLQVGKAGHDGVCLALGQVQQASLQAGQFLGNHVDFIAQVQADIGGHLIIPAAAGMQFLAGDADAVGQPGFDVHVHVFQADGPLEATGLDVFLHAFQAVDDLVALGVSQHTHFRQHGGMGDRAGNIMVIQALIKTHRGGEAFNKGIGRLAEAATPGFFGGCGLVRLFLIRHGLSFLLTARHHHAGNG